MGYLVQYIFKLIDNDKSGTLDPKELYDMFVDHHLKINKRLFKKIFGRENQLTFIEFKKIIDDP